MSQMSHSKQSRKKYKAWCFTDFNDEFTFNPELMEYAIVGEEICPDTGRRHGQGYVYFTNRQYFSGAKQHIGPRCHIEKARGSISDNVAYCSKDGRYKESGTRPKEAGQSGAEATKRKWIQIYETAKSGNLDAIEKEVLIRHYNSLRRIAFDHAHTSSRTLHHLPRVGLWIHGEPGVGKSRFVRRRYSSLFEKQINKWWDGYRGQDIVLLDDLDVVHHVLGHHIKRWADIYPFNAEVKGGAMTIRPRGVIVTSNYAPSDIWSDSSMIDAITRRFEVYINQTSDTLELIEWQPPEYLLQPKEEIIDLTEENGISQEEDIPQAEIHQESSSSYVSSSSSSACAS